MAVVSDASRLARRVVRIVPPPGWAAAIAAVVLAISCLKAYHLSGQAIDARETALLLSRLHTNAAALGLEEWKSIAVGAATAAGTGRSDKEDLESAAIIQALASHGIGGDAPGIIESYSTYRSAATDERRLLREGDAAAARALDETLVGPARDRLDGLIEEALTRHAALAGGRDGDAMIARVGVVVEFVAALLVLGMFYARHRAGIRVARATETAAATSAERFRTLVQNGSDIVTIMDADGVIQFASPTLERILGYVPEEFVGHNIFEFVHPDDIAPAIESLGNVMTRPGPGPGGYRLRLGHKNGEWRHIETTANNLMDDPMIRGIVHTSRDVTERKTAELAQERLLAIVEATSDLVLVADSDGNVLHANRAFLSLIGIERDELSRDAVRQCVPDWAWSRLSLEAVPWARAHGIWRGEVAFRTGQGDEIATEVEVLAHRGPDGEVGFLSCVGRDVTERKRFESQLIHLADYDALTGLYNRRRFEEKLSLEISRAHQAGQTSAVLFLDVDSFKAVNDGAGHRAGDELLLAIGDTLRAVVGPRDIVARMGGDEFGALLVGRDLAQAETIAEEICRAVRAHRLRLGGEMISTTLSLGVAMMPAHGETAHDLLMHADLAMYEAKTQRNAYRVFSPDADYDRDLTSRWLWEDRIRSTIEQDGFILYAQPVRSLDGTVAHYELLLRIEDEDGALIGPGSFLPIAEQSGLIHLIDRSVVRKAMALVHEHEMAGLGTCFAVNISARSLNDPEMPGLLERGFHELGIDPSHLIIEITETAAIADIDKARRFIEPLRRLGVRFAIDDFGAGFASFSYLKRLPVEHVKIDGSFIGNLARDVEDQHIVKGMVDIIHGLGKKATAEFVEDQETLDLLKVMGVDYFQGYHLGRPGPVCDLRGRNGKRAA